MEYDIKTKYDRIGSHLTGMTKEEWRHSFRVVLVFLVISVPIAYYGINKFADYHFCPNHVCQTIK